MAEKVKFSLREWLSKSENTIIACFYLLTGVVMAMTFLETVTAGNVILPMAALHIYQALLPAYTGKNEFDRAKLRKQKARKGELFAIAWIVMTAVLIVLVGLFPNATEVANSARGIVRKTGFAINFPSYYALLIGEVVAVWIGGKTAKQLTKLKLEKEGKAS